MTALQRILPALCCLSGFASVGPAQSAGRAVATATQSRGGSIRDTAMRDTLIRNDQDLTTGFQQAHWGVNVTVTYANGKLHFVSDGIPNHPRDAEYAVGGGRGGAIPNAASATAVADPTRAQHYDFLIPTTPVKAQSPTAAPLGVIGVMISGASLFNPYEGDGRTVASQSNFSVTGTGGKQAWFLDHCNGHPQPMMGTYHYHALPPCVTSQVDQPNGASHIIGIAFDGYAIYGDRDVNGAKVDPSLLDACNGISSATPEFPNGVYHYVLLDVAGANSSIRCFSGVVDPSRTRGMRGPPGMHGGPDMQGPPGMRPPPRKPPAPLNRPN